MESKQYLTPQRCNKHNKLNHDFFISYRVSADHISAEKLAAHIDGRQKQDGKHFKTYLDKNCLIQGKDWEVGFTYGINHSDVILLLISQGLINTMHGKAKRDEVDNVLKEHKIALELRNHGRLIVPVYVATLGTTKSRRDCYIKVDRAAALRMFDGHGEDDATRERLHERREILDQIFQIPTCVSIEPDSISEKVPKILQLWYAEFSKAKKPLQSVGCMASEQEKQKKVKLDYLTRLIKYPTQSLRLMLVGVVIGFFGAIVTLSLLFMQSKSKKHTDLKFGVAIGNMLAFVLLTLVCLSYCASLFITSSNVYCNNCEAVLMAIWDSEASMKYYSQIPDISKIMDRCDICWTVDPAALNPCLGCACSAVYETCELSYAGSIALLAVVMLLILMITGTAILTSRFTRRESFSMSLMQ